MEHSTPKPRYSKPRGGYNLSQHWTYNDYRTEGDVAYIALRDRLGAVAAEACIDTADLDRVLHTTVWSLFRSATLGLHYAAGNARTLPGKGRKPRLYLHRVIMDAPQGSEVDHDNGNGLDCRRSNLCITTHKGNQNNRRQHRRARQLEDAIVRLLRCDHAEGTCDCRQYARSLLPQAA